MGTATPPDLELEESTSGEHEEGPLKERGNQVTYPSTCALRTLAGGLVADQCRLAGKRNASNWLLLWGQEPLLQVPWGARTIFQVGLRLGFGRLRNDQFHICLLLISRLFSRLRLNVHVDQTTATTIFQIDHVTRSRSYLRALCTPAPMVFK